MATLIRIALVSLLLTACGGPELESWHTVDLQEEFHTGTIDETATFADYLALEARLFEELDGEIYAQADTGPAQTLNRYSPGSAADPRGRQPNWNRTIELVPEAPRGGVLLLHGMSDSPYSLRALGEALFEEGYRVLALRLPGHGTLPSGLTTVRWQDMAASVGLAMNHLSAHLSDKPVHIIGYSTGASLALEYALDAAQQSGRREPASLVLVSPAVGLSPIAALATWQRRLSGLPGLGRLAWLSIDPEFDPYKYNSFATNAAEQVFLLTREVSQRLEQHSNNDGTRLPPMLVFKSTVDATVSTSAVIDRLLMRLAASRHELVLYDINRSAIASPLLVNDPAPVTNRLLQEELPFALTLVSNESTAGNTVVARFRAATSSALAISHRFTSPWPRGVLSLSHVALPFPADDPLYGSVPPADSEELFLGQLPLQGERGLLKISTDWLFRLRHNPFYDHLEARTVDWVNGAGRIPESP